MTLATLAFMVAAAALVALALSEGAEAQINEIVIELDPQDKDQMAHPTDVSQDLLTFDGNLTLNRIGWFPGAPPVEVTLELEISKGEVWDWIFDPPMMSFTASETKNFTCTVTVPLDLAAASFFTLEFTATSSLLINELTPDTARVTIAQYYKIGRQFSTEPIRVKQGDLKAFNLTVTNRGNGDDTFIFEVANEAELLFAGLTVYYERSKRVPPGEDVVVDLRVEAADDALETQMQINLTITSEGSSTDPSLERPVTSGAEWTVVVEPSIATQVFANLEYIIVGVVALVVVVGVAVVLRRRKRAKAEAEDLEEGDEDADDGE